LVPFTLVVKPLQPLIIKEPRSYIMIRQTFWNFRPFLLAKTQNYPGATLRGRELRAHVFLGPAGPRPGAFFTNIQHPVCTWIYRDHDLTTCNWLSREKNRYAIISWCLFLSINAPKIKSCHLVEKSRMNVLYVDLSSIVFRF
jgi:hypothetical protein